VAPYAEKHGIEAVMVQAVDVEKKPLPALIEHIRAAPSRGMKSLGIPLYGSEGGQLVQSCTDKWKIRAIRQFAKDRGAKTLRTAQGIHIGEAYRRVKGRHIGKEGRWTIYQDTIRRDHKEVDVKWCSHYYPLVDLRMTRRDAQRLLETEGLPYLISSECDMCPHQDIERWDRHTPEVLQHIAEIERSFDGEYFFTDERIPLLDALAIKRSRKGAQGEIDFGCESGGYCGV
jgi:hypothetical protein